MTAAELIALIKLMEDLAPPAVDLVRGLLQKLQGATPADRSNGQRAKRYGHSRDRRRTGKAAAEVGLMPYPHVTEARKQAKYIQEPQNHDDDHHDVDDFLDGVGHRDVGIRQPEQDSDDDERYNYRNERHDSSILRMNKLEVPRIGARVWRIDRPTPAPPKS